MSAGHDQNTLCKQKKEAYLEQGHWFFHEGQSAVCASTGQHENGEWGVKIHFQKWDKPLSEQIIWFESLDQAKNFVSQYFEQPVVNCNPSEFPTPSSL